MFDKPARRYPIVAELLAIAVAFQGRLRVMDFGGALGSLYFQHRSYFDSIEEIKWGVVEQKSSVETGRTHVVDPNIEFHETIESCIASVKPDIVVATCVLQHLSDPWGTLHELLKASPKIIIDRLPLINTDVDRLTVQNVNEKIYPASYPAWVFSRSNFINVVENYGYQILNEFESIDELELDNLTLRTVGLVIQKKEVA